MSSNQTARQKLEKIFGKQCFFKRANCAERIEAMGGIKTYKTFLKQRKYTGKKISHQLTYHHLRHKSEGGTATVENGAILEETVHQYVHSLPRDQEEVINEMLREFKLTFGVMSTEGIYETGVKQLDFDIDEENAFVIQAYNNTKEECLQKIEDEIEQERIKKQKKKEKYRRLKNPTRAMKKRELQEMIEEEEMEL